MQYKLYVLHDNAVCPECSGNVKRQIFDDGTLVFVCNDCKARYRIADYGDAEKEFVVEKY